MTARRVRWFRRASPDVDATHQPRTRHQGKIEVTTPAGVILRTTEFSRSVTKTLPAASTAMAVGTLKRAALPVPSTYPKLPARPASVVTTAAGVILRIVWLPVSATYTLPAPSTATENGVANRAALPVPSALPGLFAKPAKVLTVPAGVILRMVLLI